MERFIRFKFAQFLSHSSGEMNFQMFDFLFLHGIPSGRTTILIWSWYLDPLSGSYERGCRPAKRLVQPFLFEIQY